MATTNGKSASACVGSAAGSALLALLLFSGCTPPPRHSLGDFVECKTTGLRGMVIYHLRSDYYEIRTEQNRIIWRRDFEIKPSPPNTAYQPPEGEARRLTGDAG